VVRKLPYWAFALLCALWMVTLALGGVGINMKWRLDSTTNILLGAVGFGLFWLGVYFFSSFLSDEETSESNQEDSEDYSDIYSDEDLMIDDEDLVDTE